MNKYFQFGFTLTIVIERPSVPFHIHLPLLFNFFLLFWYNCAAFNIPFGLRFFILISKCYCFIHFLLTFLSSSFSVCMSMWMIFSFSYCVCVDLWKCKENERQKMWISVLFGAWLILIQAKVLWNDIQYRWKKIKPTKYNIWTILIEEQITCLCFFFVSLWFSNYFFFSILFVLH